MIEIVKPWGKEELIHQGNDYAVKRITLRKAHSTSLHYHEIKHETIMVHSGKLTILVGTEATSLMEKVLLPGDSVSIEPLKIHRMIALQEDCVYFEAQSDFLEDVIRLSDSYGRGV